MSGVTGFIQSQWNDITAGAKSAQLLFARQAQLAAISIRELVGNITGEQAASMREAVEADFAKAVLGIEDAANEVERKIRSTQDSERRRIEELRDTVAAGIASDLESAISNVADGLEDGIAQSERALEEAKARLAAALQKANAVAIDSDSGIGDLDASLTDLLSVIKSSVSGVVAESAKLGSQGAFVVGNNLGLQSQSNDRMVKGIEKIELNTRSLRDGGIGGSFA
jgi:hypothetical protein